MGTIVAIRNGLLTIKAHKEGAKKPHIIQFSMSRYNNLDYGYAATVYKGQGGTFDQSFVLASRHFDRHSTDVAMTRHRDGAELFWSKEAFPSYGHIAPALSRDGSKDLAHDYINDEFDKVSFASHRGLDTLWDTFWEKYGTKWLEKIQHTVSSWIDSAKGHAEKWQGADTAFDKRDVSTGEDFNDSAWLKEMRAIRDEAYRNNPELEKELNARRGATQDNDSNDICTLPSIYTEGPVTDEQRAYYEARYEAIMKEHETRTELDHMLQQFEKVNREKPEKTLQHEEKDIDEKDIEIDF